MVAGASRENGMETPMHENPEWEKARQALASISKAGATSSSKASSSGPVASAQVRMSCRIWELLCWGGTCREEDGKDAGFCRMECLRQTVNLFSCYKSDNGKKLTTLGQPGPE